MGSANPVSLTLHGTIHTSLEAIDADEWNQLNGTHEPFLHHEFLIALERHGCVGQEFGWYPRHLVVKDARGRLQGAMPMYLKTNSYGEFVFDWSWAAAYQRSGLNYYPKLVVAVPYNPITGPRLLVHPHGNAHATKQLLINQAIRFAQNHQLTGLHWLFTNQEDTQLLKQHGLMMRLGCQYHWHNRDYEDFDHFLGYLISRKRKKIKRERRRVQEQGISLQIMLGHEVDDELWSLIHHLYADTFHRKSGIPTLTLGFFKEIGQTMGERIIVVLAKHAHRIVACAVNFRSDENLYGRFWGCDTEFHSLHFEACYYQGMAYCIANGLKRFEPGAQGEHKIARGFLPTRTWSAHWIAQQEFHRPLSNFCFHEQQMMEQEYETLYEHSPYREEMVNDSDSDDGHSLD